MKTPEVHIARIGSCLRALSLHMIGVPETRVTDKAKLKIFREGERLEDITREQLVSKGHKITKGEETHKEIKINGHKIEIVGRPDIDWKEKKVIYPGEIKTLNGYRFKNVPSRFSDWTDKLKFKYGYQMGGYAWLRGVDRIPWVLKEKVRGNDNSLVRVIWIDRDELPSEEDILARLEIASAIFDGYEVLPEHLGDCSYCNYWNNELPWEKSDCAKKWGKEYLSKLENVDKPFNKKVVNLGKDLEDSRAELRLAEEKYLKYRMLFDLKYKLVNKKKKK